MSSHVYEIIRQVYSASSAEASDASRVPVLQSTLAQLRLTNIATLDACMNHFTRLIDLTSADEAYVAALATNLAPCVLRPKTETSLTLEERHAYRLLRDLFAHKDAIFSELKRMSTLSHSNSVGKGSSPSGAAAAAAAAAGPGGASSTPVRPRAISTDESNRKAHMEERARAIIEKASGSRSRATSPAPSPRLPPAGFGGADHPRPAGASMGHRRDRSVGGPETRFPVAVASPTGGAGNRGSVASMAALQAAKRHSLEVPGAAGPVADLSSMAGGLGLSNGGDFDGADGMLGEPGAGGSGIQKRNSISGRSTTRFVGGRRVVSGAPPAPDQQPGHGVTLVDRPMDN